MLGLPPLPPIEGMHPIVVHFPIGILMIAWVPMVLGLVDRKRRHGWFLSALMLLVLGTAFAFAAVFTGGETEEVVEHSSQAIEHAIHEHEEVAELARNLFVGVTAIFLASLILHCKVGASKKKLVGLLGGVLVAVSYGFGALAMMNAGHQGGLLVHDLGIKAPMNAGALPSDAERALIREEHDESGDDDD